MDPKKLPTLEDLRGAPVRLSYHEVTAVFVSETLFLCKRLFGVAELGSSRLCVFLSSGQVLLPEVRTGC